MDEKDKKIEYQSSQSSNVEIVFGHEPLKFEYNDTKIGKINEDDKNDNNNRESIIRLYAFQQNADTMGIPTTDYATAEREYFSKVYKPKPEQPKNINIEQQTLDKVERNNRYNKETFNESMSFIGKRLLGNTVVGATFLASGSVEAIGSFAIVAALAEVAKAIDVYEGLISKEPSEPTATSYFGSMLVSIGYCLADMCFGHLGTKLDNREALEETLSTIGEPIPKNIFGMTSIKKSTRLLNERLQTQEPS